MKGKLNPYIPTGARQEPANVSGSGIPDWFHYIILAYPVIFVLAVHITWAAACLSLRQAPTDQDVNELGLFVQLMHDVSQYLMICYPFAIVASALTPLVDNRLSFTKRISVLFVNAVLWALAIFVLATDPLDATWYR